MTAMRHLESIVVCRGVADVVITTVIAALSFLALNLAAVTFFSKGDSSIPSDVACTPKQDEDKAESCTHEKKE